MEEGKGGMGSKGAAGENSGNMDEGKGDRDKALKGAAGENGDDGTIWCIECEDVAASVRCDACGGDYMCGLCFQWQHRSGRRALHKPTPLPGKEMFRETAEGTTQHFIKLQQQSAQKPVTTVDQHASASRRDDSSNGEADTATRCGDGEAASKVQPGGALRARIAQMAQYIPVRISAEERVYLRLLEGALEVSEYTDKIDAVRAWGWNNSKVDRIREEIGDLLQLLLGLVVAGNYSEGAKVVSAGDGQKNAEFFQKVLEIGRRYKITNPEKMRCTYGKLIYLMQDAPCAMDFSVRAEIRTVSRVLQEKEGLAMLDDEDTPIAIDAVSNAAGYGQEAPTRDTLEARTAGKRAAIGRLCQRYASDKLSKEVIEYCLASLADFNAFIDSNRRPVDDMITLLKTTFDPHDGCTLEINAGFRGSKLSHSHATQYKFVLQSLMLWQKITENMFRLWILAEKDLLNEDNNYGLVNTGQGTHRLQSAPNISRAMLHILTKVQEAAGSWVGLSVVHLGDRDVPNALVFIDKYTQIARLLQPIVDCIKALPLLAADQTTAGIIEKYGGAHRLQKLILADFFKHGFDGSGSDGGSCIDGRLTSAWNWCSKLEKKSFYPIFMLAGFQGFDGDFRS